MGAIPNKSNLQNLQGVNKGGTYIFLADLNDSDAIFQPIEIKNEVSLQEIRDQLQQRLNALSIQLFFDGKPVAEEELQKRINLQNIGQYSESKLQYKTKKIKIIEQNKNADLINFDDDYYKQQYEKLRNEYANLYFKHNSLLKKYEAMQREYQKQIDQLKQNFIEFQQQNLKQKSELFENQKKIEQQKQQLSQTLTFYKNQCGHTLTPKIIEETVYTAFMSNTVALCPDCNPKKISEKLIRTVCPQIGEVHLLKLFTQQLATLEENIQVQNKQEVRKCCTFSCQFFCIWNQKYDIPKQLEYYCPNCLIYSVKKSQVNLNIFNCQALFSNASKTQ